MPFTLHQQHHIQTIMELVLLVVVQCLSWTSGSPIAMLHHATSSQSFLLHPQPSGTSSGGGGSPISGHSTSNQPRYEFKYEVSDHATGDRKSHWETREGDRVRGGYTLYEPDGAQRRVEYTADAQHGFNAIVTRNGQSKHFPPPRSSDYGAGYESSTRASGYLADRTSNRDLKYQTEVNEAPVGYSVTHVGQIKRPLDNEPY